MHYQVALPVRLVRAITDDGEADIEESAMISISYLEEFAQATTMLNDVGMEVIFSK